MSCHSVTDAGTSGDVRHDALEEAEVREFSAETEICLIWDVNSTAVVSSQYENNWGKEGGGSGDRPLFAIRRRRCQRSWAGDVSVGPTRQVSGICNKKNPRIVYSAWRKATLMSDLSSQLDSWSHRPFTARKNDDHQLKELFADKNSINMSGGWLLKERRNHDFYCFKISQMNANHQLRKNDVICAFREFIMIFFWKIATSSKP